MDDAVMGEEVEDGVPDELLDAAARHGLAVHRHPPVAIAVSNGDGRPLVWVSDLGGLYAGTVAPEDHDALAGPWEQVIFVDPGDTPARRALAAELVKALTGGPCRANSAGDGAALVAGEEGLTLVPGPGPDLEDEAVPLAGRRTSAPRAATGPCWRWGRRSTRRRCGEIGDGGGARLWEPPGVFSQQASTDFHPPT